MQHPTEHVLVQVALDHGMYDARAPDAGYLLTLSLPGEAEDTCFFDKLDILEEQGLKAAQPFTLQPRAPPPPEMIAFLRLMNTRGVATPPCLLRLARPHCACMPANHT